MVFFLADGGDFPTELVDVPADSYRQIACAGLKLQKNNGRLRSNVQESVFQ
jgi:hypothetical protein